MEAVKGTRSCILEITTRIHDTRLKCQEESVPEEIQDAYEDILDTILERFGITPKQRELFWTLTDD